MAADSLVTTIEDHVVLSGSKGCDLNSVWPIMQAAGIEKHDYCKILGSITSLCYYRGDQEVEKPTCLEGAADIRVVAPLEIRRKTLTRELKHGTITENHFMVLEKIAQSREEGVLQVQIGRDLGIDTRTVYSVIKHLEKLKLIVKRRTAASSTWTNIIHHVRFAPKSDSLINPDGSIYYDVMRKKLVDLLSNARDNMMPIFELLNSFRFTELQQEKWARRFIDRAIGEGYVKKLTLIADGRKTVCIKLVGLPSQNDVSTPTAVPEKDDNPIKKSYTLKGPALQKKVTRCVLDSGEKGITCKEIEESLPSANPAAIKKFLRVSINTEEHNREIYNVIEPVGRSRCYRYFGRPGFEKFTQHHADTSPPNEAGQVDSLKRKCSPGREEEDDESSPKRTKIAAGQKRKQPSDDGNTDTTVVAVDTPTTPVSERGFVSRTRQSMKGSNIIMDKRKQSMTTIIHRDKVRELNNDLGAEIIQLAGEAPTNAAVARVTWMRMAEALQKTNTIKIVKSLVPTFGGGTEYKVLFLHPDLNESDDIVRQYLDRLRMGKVVKPVVQKKRSLTVVNDDFAPPERSQDTMTHQQTTYDVVYTMPERFWREVALRHGWVSSKWLRAKVLHEHLFEQSNEERTVDLAFIVTNLPLNIFCQTIGISRFHEEVEEFMRLNNDPYIALTQIPTEVRRKMIPPNFLFRARLLKLINLLGALELIESISDSTDTRVLRLTDIGEIRNFADDSRPVVQQVPLNTMDDIRTFWKELQFACTCLYPKISEGRKKQQQQQQQSPVADELSSVCWPQTWNVGTSLTLEQRQTLESYVDRSQKTVPLDDEQLILHIARELCLQPARIKRYFEGIMRIMHGNPPKIRPRKKPPSVLVSKLVATAKSGESVPSAIEAAAAGTGSQKNVERTFAPTRKFLQHRYQSPDSAAPTLRPNRKQKLEWSVTEDDALLHCHAILSHRAALLQKPLTWKPVLKILPGRDTEQYRRRLHHLRRGNPSAEDEMERLRRQWRKIYEEGIRSGELIDERIWDMFDFDLKGQLEYFIIKLQNHFNSTTVTTLPKSRRELEDQYDVVFDEIHTRPSTQRTVQVDLECDRSIRRKYTTTKGIETALVSVIIKMSLLTPSKEYNPQDAHALLGQFPSKVIGKAMEKMRKEGMLIKYRRQGSVRLVPGRMFNFSEKFLKKFSSAYYPHHLLKKAANFYCTCHDGAILEENQYTQDTMAVLLDMLSDGQMTLTLDRENQYYELRRGSSYPRLIHEALCENWLDKGFNVCIHNEQEKRTPVLEVMNEQFAIPSGKEISTIDAFTKSIYDMIGSFGRKGCTLLILKERLKIPEEDIVDGVDTLMSRSLVIRVGFSDLRLVTATHAAKWLAPTGDGVYIKPRMWSDVKGMVMPSVLHGCANAVLEQILKHPGITQMRLVEEFKGYMTSNEVYDLLLFLERNGAIKSKAFDQTVSRVNLFGRRRVAAQALAPNKIGENRTTHYWTLPNYYLWVKPLLEQ